MADSFPHFRGCGVPGCFSSWRIWKPLETSSFCSSMTDRDKNLKGWGHESSRMIHLIKQRAVICIFSSLRHIKHLMCHSWKREKNAIREVAENCRNLQESGSNGSLWFYIWAYISCMEIFQNVRRRNETAETSGLDLAGPTMEWRTMWGGASLGAKSPKP